MRVVKTICLSVVIVLITHTINVQAYTFYLFNYDYYENDFSEKYYDIPLCDDFSYNHNWDYYGKKQPTGFKEGYYIYECPKCSYMKFVSIPKRPLNKKEKKAKSIITKYLKSAKKYNIKKMNKCFYDKECSLKYPTNKKIAKIFRTYNKKKLKWRMIGGLGKGAHYTLKYEVELPFLGEAAYKASFKSHKYEGEYGYSKKKKIKKFLKYAKKYRGETFSCYVKFSVIKTKKGWKIHNKTRKMVNISTCLYLVGDEYGRKDAPYDLWDDYKYDPFRAYFYE